MRRSKHGFTVVEMAAVVAILGLLIAIAIPVVSSQLEAARANACAGDREAARQLVTVAAQLDDDFNRFVTDGMSWGNVQTRLKDIDAHLTEISCPSNGMLTMKVEGTDEDKSFSIICSKHTGGELDPETPSQEFLADFQSFITENRTQIGNSNDNLRRAFFAQHHNQFPTLTLVDGNGKTYQIEPFYQQNTGDIQNSWLFAREGDGTTIPKNGNWYVPLLYDPIDGVWYQPVNDNGKPTNISINKFSSVQVLHDEVTTSRSWKAVEVTYNT